MLPGSLGVTPYVSRLAIYGRQFTLCAMLSALCDILSNSKLPKKKIWERMDYFKDQANQLMKIRKSGHRPARKIRGGRRGKKTKS